MKYCPHCNTVKEFFSFSKDRTKPRGLSSICKECHKEISLKYYYKHKELCANRQKAWRKDNPWYRTYQACCGRIFNKNNPAYKYYGGKGIKLLMSPNHFRRLWERDRAWLLNRPSIDRINPNEHYTFDNCRYIELTDNSFRALEARWSK